MYCSSCDSKIEAISKFCSNCGQKVEHSETVVVAKQREEHKFITIVFSDVTGYTSMSEKLDPEEVKEILRQIFSEINRITNKYEGRIHERIGDCAVLVFGDPQAKEDDAFRALLAVTEIHEAVMHLNTPELEEKLGRKLSLHSGVNTGSVLVGKEELKGNVQILGDNVNTAARLDSIAKSDEIMVSKSTYQLCRNRFDFEVLDPINLKGKSELQEIYRLEGRRRKKKGVAISPRRAKLVGRQHELAQLDFGVTEMRNGSSNLFTIHAEAGGGKTRFVNEWKDKLLGSCHLHQGVAHNITQKNSYALWTNFFQTYWKFDEVMDEETIRTKIEGSLNNFSLHSACPFIGLLLGIRYAELETLDVAYIKNRVFESVLQLIEKIVLAGEALFLFEDLHWADSSSIELLKYVIERIENPCLILCTFRSHFNLYEGCDSKGIFRHTDIALKALSNADEELMLQSLLKTSDVPAPLVAYVADKISGNPFYIEEFVSDLIESGKLVKNGKWSIKADLLGQDIPHTIEGVIRSRIDRLETETKSIIQQASVIGRSFYYEILKKLNNSQIEIDDHISTLQRSDIIHKQQKDPQVEYIFKHALLQEVTYHSLLKEDRKSIHLRAAQVIEETFVDRLDDFYEILAYHYTRSYSRSNAVKYLCLAGKKSQKALAAMEADQYFQQAYDLLVGTEGLANSDEMQLLTLLVDWGYAKYHLANFSSQLQLLEKHKEVIDRCPDLSIKAWLYGWMCTAQQFQMKGGDLSARYIEQAIQYAEESQNKRTMAYCYAWASSNTVITSQTKKGEKYGWLALNLSQGFPDDHYIIAKGRYGLALCLALNGKVLAGLRMAHECIEIGNSLNSPRISSMGNLAVGLIRQGTHHHEKATEYLGRGATFAPDPLYSTLGFSMQALSFSLLGKYQAMEDAIASLNRSRVGEVEPLNATLVSLSRANQSISKGQIKEGLNEVKSMIEISKKEHLFSLAVRFLEVVIDKHLKVMKGEFRPSLPFISRNPIFVSKFLLNLNAYTKSMILELTSIARDSELCYYEAMGSFYEGLYYKLRKKQQQAKTCFLAAREKMSSLEMPDELNKVEEQIALI